MGIPSLRALRLFGGAVVAATIVAAVALPIVRPEWVERKDTPTSIINQDGLLEQFHWPWYFVGAALLLAAVRHDRAYAGFYRCAALGMFLLGWREADFDDIFLGDRWYDGPRHLFDGKLSTVGTVGLILLFVLFVAMIAWVVARNHRHVLPWLRDRRWCRPGWIAGVGFALLASSVLFDKYATLKKHTGIDLDFRFRVHWEEAVEMIGAAVLMAAAIEVYAVALTLAPAEGQPTGDLTHAAAPRR